MMHSVNWCRIFATHSTGSSVFSLWKIDSAFKMLGCFLFGKLIQHLKCWGGVANIIVTCTVHDVLYNMVAYAFVSHFFLQAHIQAGH